MVLPGLAAGASRTKAARLAGVLESEPAIGPRPSKSTSEGPLRPLGQAMSGKAWQPAQPTALTSSRPRAIASARLSCLASGGALHAETAAASIRARAMEPRPRPAF